MEEQPQAAPWTRREFLKGTAVAGGLAVGAARSRAGVSEALSAGQRRE